MSELIEGRFQIEADAGRGGTARVYRACDIATGKVIALKILDRSTDDVVARFRREAAILGELRHPAIVGYVAHGALTTGEPYLAMEWLDGEDLEAHLARRRLSVDQTIALGTAIASALGELHARGVAHRDVKPGNIFLPDGDIARPKLLDLGMARHARDLTLTKTGQILGTPLYMAPEQAGGARGVDQRADVFALGGVLYACLAGRPPFAATTLVALLAKIVLEDPPPLSALAPDTPADLADLIDRMMAKRPDHRPVDGRQIAAALERIGAGQPVELGEVHPEHLSASVEQRVVCVVLVAAGDADPLALGDTLEAAQGAHRLADGSQVLVFSGPESPGDLTARAVQRALELAGRDGAAAVSCGRMIVSGATPMGELIEVAARQLERATRCVRLDESTAGLIEGRFELTHDGDGAAIAGRPARATDDVRTLLGRRTRLVGRSRELSTLEAYYSECVDEDAVNAVLVTGPAGMGKSRLSRELLRRLAESDDPPSVIVARAESVSAGSPFSMVAAGLRTAAEIEPADAPAARRAKITRRIGDDAAAEFLCAAAGLPPVAAPSPAMLAALHSPAEMFDRIREAWIAWLRREASECPVVIVAEDLHWGDQPSIQLLEAALRALDGAPLLVLALAREEVHERFPRLWGGRAHELRLDPLRAKISRRFVREALAGATDSVVAEIVERAAGNAFFLEELIRSAAAGELSRVPDGVVGVVQLRLDGLAADTRLVLRGATVYGERFDAAAVEALTGGRVDVAAALDELIEAELIERAPEGAANQYSFRHALVQEAGYALLADDERKLAHALAGGYLESVGSAEAIVVAEHYDDGDVSDRAAHWYEVAARGALAGNDLHSALDYARRARRSTAGPSDRARLDTMLAEIEIWQGNLDAAVELARNAVEELNPGSADWLAAIGLLITSAGQLGDNDAVGHWLDRVMETEPDEGAIEPFVLGLARAASQLVWAQRIDIARRAIAYINDVVDVDELSPHVRARVHYAEAYDALYAGAVLQCVDGLARAAACFERIGSGRDALQARMLSMLFRGLSGEFDEPIAELKVIVERAKAMDAEYLEHWSRFELAMVQILSGRFDEGLATWAQTSDMVKAQPLFAGSSAVWLAYVGFARNDAAAVRQAADAVRDIAIPDRYAATMRAFEAWLELDAGDRRVAEQLALDALADLDRVVGMRADPYLTGYTIVATVLAGVESAATEDLVRTHCERLYAVARAVGSPTDGDRFLQCIPWNRDFLALAERIGIDPGSPQ